MKHLKLYENYKKPFYELNVPEFFTTFKEIFYQEISKDGAESSPFLLELSNILNYKIIPLSSTIEQIVKYILINKEIEFYNTVGDLEFGRAANIICYKLLYGKDFQFNITFYDKNSKVVNYTKPVKIYGEPSKLENIIEMLSTANKYNL